MLEGRQAGELLTCGGLGGWVPKEHAGQGRNLRAEVGPQWAPRSRELTLSHWSPAFHGHAAILCHSSGHPGSHWLLGKNLCPDLCCVFGRAAQLHTHGNPGRERGRADMCQTQQALQAAWGALAHRSRCSLRAVFPSKQRVILMISPLCKTKDLKFRKDDRAAQSKGQSQALNLPFSDSQGRARLRLPGRGLPPVLRQMGSPLGHWLSSAGRFPQQKRAVRVCSCRW